MDGLMIWAKIRLIPGSIADWENLLIDHHPEVHSKEGVELRGCPRVLSPVVSPSQTLNWKLWKRKQKSMS